jgi:hypothetical protein
MIISVESFSIHSVAKLDEGTSHATNQDQRRAISVGIGLLQKIADKELTQVKGLGQIRGTAGAATVNRGVQSQLPPPPQSAWHAHYRCALDTSALPTD